MMIDLFDVSYDGKVVTRTKTGNTLKQTLTKKGYKKDHTMIDKKKECVGSSFGGDKVHP